MFFTALTHVEQLADTVADADAGEIYNNLTNGEDLNSAATSAVHIVVGIVLFSCCVGCCCCFLIYKLFCSNSSGDSSDDDDSDSTPLKSNRVRPARQPKYEANSFRDAPDGVDPDEARDFLDSLRQEYCDRSDGRVGEFFDRNNHLVGVLSEFENRVSESFNPEDECHCIEDEWNGR